MKPNKYQRRADLYNRLAKLGFTMEEADKLRRIEKTLHRWAEHECNGLIQRCEKTGRPFQRYGNYAQADNPRSFHFIADRERGALKRLEAIVDEANRRNLEAEHKAAKAERRFAEDVYVWFYHQTDPRGCSVFIGRKSDLRPGQDLSGCYSSVGVAVCD